MSTDAGAPLTAADKRHFTALLRRRLAEADEHAARVLNSLTEAQAARADGGNDDEHDPDGPTLAQEWSQLAGLANEANTEHREILRAIERLRDGTFGICANCGSPIGRPRLDAVPTTRLCIDCARKA